MRPMKIMIVGHGRHGKDTVAEMLRDKYRMQFQSSSFACAQRIFPLLKDEYGYKDVQACFNDRHNHRAEWFDLICEFNSPDKASIGRAVYANSDIYVGVRDWRELTAIRNVGLFDLCIWVDRRDHCPPEGKGSMNIEPWMADCMLDNNGTLEDLEVNLRQLMATWILQLQDKSIDLPILM